MAMTRDEVTGAIEALSLITGAAAEFKKIDVQERMNILDREHEIEKMNIANTLNDLNYKRNRRDTLTDRIAELGIIQNDLGSVDDANITSGSNSIIEEEGISVNNELNNIETQIFDLSNTIKSYHTGLNLGKNIDLDKSGEIKPEELTEWFKISGTDPKYLDDKAFESGIRAYERTPEALIELGLATTASKVEELKLKFLPNSLKQEEDLKDLKIDLSQKELLMMDDKIEQVKIQTSLAKAQLQNVDTNKQLNQLQIESAEYQFNKQIRIDTIESLEKSLVDNISAQSAIGAGILANMSLEIDDNKFLPMFHVLAGTTEDKYLEKIAESDNLNFIAGDLQELYVAYGIGTSDETLPDYSFVLNKVEDIVATDSMYREFVSIYDDELRNTAVQMNISNKYDIKVLERVAMDKDPERFNLKTILKARQWHRTGIFDDMEGLNTAIKTVQQNKDLQSMVEYSKGLDYTYSSGLYDENIYAPDDIKNMLNPFTMRTVDQFNPTVTKIDSSVESNIQSVFDEIYKR